MKIVTWNINSIRPRLQAFVAYLEESQPDVILLQETKCEDHAFPQEELERLGYNIATHGQKTYNGVAICSRYPLEVEQRGLPGNEDDPQARYIEGVISLPNSSAIRVASVYVPNGQAVDSDKFVYKQQFLAHLHAHVTQLLTYEEILVLGGDYNIAPRQDDVYDPTSLEGSICFHPIERSAFYTLENLGLVDAWRAQHPDTRAFSWWDYRAGGYQQNKGLRIDHLLLSPEAADRLHSTAMDESERAKEKPSDHIPVWCVLDV